MILDTVFNAVSQDLQPWLRYYLRGASLVDIQSVSDHWFVVDPACKWNLRTDFVACFPPPHAQGM